MVYVQRVYHRKRTERYLLQKKVLLVKALVNSISIAQSFRILWFSLWMVKYSSRVMGLILRVDKGFVLLFRVIARDKAWGLILYMYSGFAIGKEQKDVYCN